MKRFVVVLFAVALLFTMATAVIAKTPRFSLQSTKVPISNTLLICKLRLYQQSKN